MKTALNIFNFLYNIFFRGVTFMASFYVFSSVLFLFIPYHIICKSDCTLLAVFILLCISSYLFMKNIISTILQLTK